MSCSLMWFWRQTSLPSVFWRLFKRGSRECQLKNRPSSGWTTPSEAPLRSSIVKLFRGYMVIKLQTSQMGLRRTLLSLYLLCSKGQHKCYCLKVTPCQKIHKTIKMSCTVVRKGYFFEREQISQFLKLFFFYSLQYNLNSIVHDYGNYSKAYRAAQFFKLKSKL